MNQIPKIYLFNRGRALEIMWYMDAIYDENKYLHYWMVQDKVTKKEWLITQMYFCGSYTADNVIKKLKTNYPFGNII